MEVVAATTPIIPPFSVFLPSHVCSLVHIEHDVNLVAPGGFVSSFVDTTCLRQEHRRRINVAFDLLVVIPLGGGGDPKS